MTLLTWPSHTTAMEGATRRNTMLHHQIKKPRQPVFIDLTGEIWPPPHLPSPWHRPETTPPPPAPPKIKLYRCKTPTGAEPGQTASYRKTPEPKTKKELPSPEAPPYPSFSSPTSSPPKYHDTLHTTCPQGAICNPHHMKDHISCALSSPCMEVVAECKFLKNLVNQKICN